MLNLLSKIKQAIGLSPERSMSGWRKPKLTAEALLDGNSMRCPGCNTLVQGEGFDPKQIAEVMAENNQRHVPGCPFGM